MKLTYVESENLKRLKGRQKMPVRDKVICIVGQNSAGKSTFLRSLERCLNGPAFVEQDGTREGRKYLSPSMKVFFEIEKADRDSVKHIYGSKNLKGVWAIIDRDGHRRFRPEPILERDTSKRESATKALKKTEVGMDTIFSEINGDGAYTELKEQFDSQCEEVMELLNSERRYFVESQINQFHQLASVITQISSNAAAWTSENKTEEDAESFLESKPFVALSPAADALNEVATKESEDSPGKVAAGILGKRVPAVLWFSPEHRNLEASYDLNDEVPHEEAAIHNLLSLAGTDWDEVAEAANSSDSSLRTQLVDEANKALKKNFSSHLTSRAIPGVSLTIEPGFLVLYTQLDEGMPVSIDLQSDGTRQMVALLAYIATKAANTNPIILIDEAEQHLHYDAQADLVKVFERQPDASKVIYTTHSAGCLPSDIAIGVRGIIPDGVYSKVEDNIWRKESGYSPLMIAMGASAFGFGVSRKTVFTEGLTDAQLLPRLIREATGKEILDYQMVPHFASADVDTLKELELESPRVAFIADHDDGGESHRQRILDAGYEEDQIIDLGDGQEGDLYLEDLVKPEILERALDALTGTKGKFSAEEMPESGRWAYIKPKLDGVDQGTLLFDKKKLASHILEISDEIRFQEPAEDDGARKRILDDRHKKALVEANRRLKKILDRKKPDRV